ncbi:fatty acid desaturase family protein [Phenylobacterium montanum]|uniref:Fatty acid desaturase family protein n=1 Tax=Phenylobacterium montanum TaxID=2823693 RepID=A0A975FXP5_9CAUL|nr:fatty acid desaturase family protein [Caulobacter sp. S6]QUD87205.1 fatty acid desaturase family protein [Caulobacter sp. S6]
MPVAARVSPKEFFTQEEWAPLAMRSAWAGPLMIAHCWAVIAGCMIVGVIWPVTIPLAIMLIGARQLGLAILMHDAAHGAIHPDQKTNDFLGEWLCGAPVGARLSSYRDYHLGHHKFAQQAEDPDLGLSAPFPITRSSLWRKVVRDLTGQTFFKQRSAVLRAQLKARPKGAPVLPIFLAEVRRQRRFYGWQLAILAACSLAGAWWAYFVLWLVPMASWYPLITRIRNIAEHALVAKNEPDPLRHARTTHAGLIERALLAPYYVNYHGEHHLFMHVPCYRLPKINRMLRARGVTGRMETAPGYLAVLRRAAPVDMAGA